MIATLWAVGSLLLSVAVLLFGHGMHLTLLPQIADAQAWSPSLNAATTSAYFAGFGAGCLIVPRWLMLIGHARAFTVLVATTTGALLALVLLQEPVAWMVLRFVYGIGISGIYLTVESWLSDATPRERRGTVLAIYAFVTLVAIFGAQLLLQALGLDRFSLLVMAAIFIVVAALPIGLSRHPQPQMSATPRIRAAAVWRRANLPAMAAGMLTGTFWALGPLLVARYDLGGDAVARFMAAAVGGGMLTVYPLGWLSDRLGRAQVLCGLALAGILATLAFLLLGSRTEVAVVTYGIAFGAVVMPLYALSLALANDLAGDADFVETGSVVIMAHAIGLVIGPLAGGWVLTGQSPAALLWAWIAGFVVLAITAAATRRADREATHAAFGLVPRSAPEALHIDPRAEAVPAVSAAEQMGAAGPAAAPSPERAAAG